MIILIHKDHISYEVRLLSLLSLQYPRTDEMPLAPGRIFHEKAVLNGSCSDRAQVCSRELIFVWNGPGLCHLVYSCPVLTGMLN